jgi:hypothetical protein
MVEQYPNRSDLRNPAQKIAKRVAPGQTYGEGAAQMRAQEAVPMGAAPTDVTAAQQTQRPRPTPGSLGALDRPSEFPDQPITAIPNQQPMMFNTADPVIEEISMLYAQYPNDDLYNLLSIIKGNV